MKKKIPYIPLLILTISIKATSGEDWATSSPADGATVHACDGGDLVLAWEARLAPGENISTVEWFSQGTSEQLIALMGFGRLTATPAYSGRVKVLDTSVGSAGIVVHGVTTAEAGTYSVAVNVNSNGVLKTLKSSVNVVVADKLMTSDVHLQTAGPLVAHDDVTDTWALGLTCGDFTYSNAGAPFTLNWITPDGREVTSSEYLNGNFILKLETPITGGNYTCLLPASAYERACVEGNGPAPAASVVVDAVNARLTLLEAQSKDLGKQVSLLTDIPQSLYNLTQEIAALMSSSNAHNDVMQELDNFTQTMKNEDAKLKDYVMQGAANISRQVALFAGEGNQQREDIANALDHMQHLVTDERNKTVVFGVSVVVNVLNSSGEILRWQRVWTNIGGGMDKTSGVFTAPVSGQYAFFLTIGATGTKVSNYLQAYIEVEGRTVAVAVSKIDEVNSVESTSVQVAVHLQANERVWVKNPKYIGWLDFDPLTPRHSSFTGFMISKDI